MKIKHEWKWYWKATLEDRYFRQRNSEAYKFLDRRFHEEKFSIKNKYVEIYEHEPRYIKR